MKKFIVSFLFLVVSLVGCKELDVPIPVDAAEDGVDIMISDDFARVPFDSLVVADDPGLPLETFENGGGPKSKGILRLKKMDLDRLPGNVLPEPVPVMADDPSLPLETHDDGDPKGTSKGILRLKHLVQERLPGAGVPGMVSDDGGVVVPEDRR